MDGLDRVKREKEKLMKDFTNIEQATDRILYEIKSLEEQVNLIDKDISNIQNKRKDFERQIADAKANVTARSKLLLKEQSKEKDFTTKANTLMEEIEELEELLQQKRKQEDIKEREHVAINKKLTGATRECAREASRVVLAKNELRMKEMYYQEIVRRHEELEKRLDSILEVFHAVKRERGQKATQIQSVTQKMTEVAEKTKILENELEVLIRESVLKEKELVRKKRQTHEVTQSCAMLRLEKSKQKKNLELTVEKEQEIKSEVRRTNTHVAQVEESMINFRNMYEDVVDSRNQAGVNLIDRNDELALLVEKVKAQEVALEHGVIITNARAEDIRRLKIHLGDLLREVKVCQSSLPKVKQLEEELAKLTEEIEDERWKTEVIEKDLTDPNNTQRWRKIEPAKLNTAAVDNTIKASIAHSMKSADSTQGAAADGNAVIAADGSEPMPVNAGGPSEEYIRLQAKCQDLESRMNDLNEKLREKELIYAEVSELSDRVGSQAESGKEHTLQMAKQVNQYQSNMRNKTRQIMSTIAELSLFQSSSIQAQQEVQRLEEIVAQAEERMAAGEAPFLEAEEEYEREKQSNERYAEQLRRNKERQNGVEPPRSTAEVRPTAYIPDGDLLGVPRPYGNHAPFKPSAPPGRFKTSNVPISSQNRRDEVGNYSSAIDGARHQASTPPPVAGGQLRLSERAETPPPRGSQ
ncbi:coiled-coil protein required for normal flagellar motility [Angomonas deanei]|nr:coiled-coil protein required for normal flagellar motility [Angomonas deanei]|eukprot:EPY29843.1 coiled-coil protein required for normal flagellar motility [Angomonas deanei]